MVRKYETILDHHNGISVVEMYSYSKKEKIFKPDWLLTLVGSLLILSCLGLVNALIGHFLYAIDS